MTRNKHPQDRSQRLKIKSKKFEEKLSKEERTLARKLYREQLKDQETKDVLQQVKNSGVESLVV